jgi:hypothetical protein
MMAWIAWLTWEFLVEAVKQQSEKYEYCRRVLADQRGARLHASLEEGHGLFLIFYRDQERQYRASAAVFAFAAGIIQQDAV